MSLVVLPSRAAWLRVSYFLNVNVEISKNPEILYEPSAPVTQLQLLGRRLYESASLLNLAEVTDAAGKNPDGVTGCSYRDGRQFYVRDGVEVEYLLSERATAVIKHGGWLTFPNRYRFRIRYEKIVEFAVHGGVLKFFRHLSKPDILERFGKPDFIDESIEHGDLMHTTFVYQQRQIRVSYDDWDNQVFMINIGESLTYGEHGKIEGPWPVTH